jgi:predicted nucleotidyltransferase
LGTAISAWHAAEQTAQWLSGRTAIRGALLFGSVARGRSDEDSDIDVLAVGVDPQVTGRALRSELPARLKRWRLSLQYMTRDQLVRLFDIGPAFTEHLRREGVILYDRDGILREIMTSPARRSMSIDDEISMQLGRLRPLSQWAQYNGNHLACLAHLYVIGKSVVILALLRAGIAEFDHRIIFSAYRNNYPDRGGDVEIVRKLQAFSRIIAGRPCELPFCYRDAEDHARAAVAAIYRLAAP